MTETPPSGQRSGPNTDQLRDLRSLRRSTSDRKIAGVAGGLGEHFNVDPLVIRVVLVVLVFFGGAGLALYGAIWILVPQDDEVEGMIHTNDRLRNALLIGAALVAALMVVGNSWGEWHFPWFLALAAVVVFAILSSRESNRSHASAETEADVKAAKAELQQAIAEYKATVKASSYRQTADDVLLPPVVVDVQRPRRRRGPILFWPTIAVAAIALGVLGIIDTNGGGTIPDAAYPTLALGVIGLGLCVGAFFGRPGGLIIVGLLIAITVPAVSIAEPGFDGDRDLKLAPQLAGDVADEYSVPAGRIFLDLTEVTDSALLAGREIDLSGNAGEIVVVLPQGLAVDVDASIEYAGGTDILGHNQGGFGIEANVGDGKALTQPLKLDIDLLVGHIEVRRG